jgi:hypothetical protein
MVAPDGSGSVTFAVSKYFFGDTDRDGTPDKVHGWSRFGFDLDGDISTACTTNTLCLPIDGALAKNVFPDGQDGIDNSFGKFVVPILLGVASDFSVKANVALLAGGATLLIDLEKLGAGTDYAPLTARLYQGAPLGTMPAYDGTDAWPVRPESLADPSDLTSAWITSASSYVVGNQWVGRFEGPLPVETALLGWPLRFVVHNPVITMTLDPQRGSATSGTLAGVLDTSLLVAESRVLAGLLSPNLCSGATIDSIAAEVAQASDILVDGTQDPTKPCTGISIGLGFEAKRVQLGPVAAPATDPPAPCTEGDAGTDGGM